MAQDNTGKSDIYAYSVKLLTMLVSSKNEDVKSNAKQAIILASTLEPCKTSFVGALVSSDIKLLLHVFGHSAAIQLNELLKDDDAYVRMHGKRLQRYFLIGRNAKLRSCWWMVYLSLIYTNTFHC